MVVESVEVEMRVGREHGPPRRRPPRVSLLLPMCRFPLSLFFAPKYIDCKSEDIPVGPEACNDISAVQRYGPSQPCFPHILSVIDLHNHPQTRSTCRSVCEVRLIQVERIVI